MTVTGSVMRGLLFVVLAAALASGCGRERPIYEVENRLIPHAAQPLTMGQIEARIIKAGVGYGWTIRPEGPGKLVGQKRWHGRHTAVVSIDYDQTAFSIRYRSSERLLVGIGEKDTPYEGEKVIHRKYNRYVQVLENSIVRELSEPGS